MSNGTGASATVEGGSHLGLGAGASTASVRRTSSNDAVQWQRTHVGGQAPSAGEDADSAVEQGSAKASSRSPPVLMARKPTSRRRTRRFTLALTLYHRPGFETTPRPDVPAPVRNRSIDHSGATGHTVFVVRWVLLAAVLCLPAWATIDRALAVSSAAAGGATAVSLDAPCGTDSPDARWDAGRRAGVSITESIWRSQLHHAELAGVACPDRLDPARQGERPHPWTPPAPPHLHRIPLLI